VIKVPFSEPLDDLRWKRWRTTAEKRRAALIEDLVAGREYTISQALYTRMRQVFLDAFHGKCAYCEALLVLDQHQGDVEHFRPKGSVTDHHDRPVMVPGPGGQPQPHRGYPWLAYDWRNLLPSCRACNQPGTTRSGRRVGKWERFPVSGFRATAPGEEENERPLLLHPVFDEPAKHLGFRPRTGFVYGKTPAGRMSVRVFDLNRERLPEERKKVYFTVTLAVRAAQGDASVEELRQAVELLRSYRDGREAYSWAGRLAMAALAAPADG
jgi:hypothetical protein